MSRKQLLPPLVGRPELWRMRPTIAMNGPAAYVASLAPFGVIVPIFVLSKETFTLRLPPDVLQYCRYMIGVTGLYSWDENKNAENREKHGISFETAQLVFNDPLHLSRQDRVEGGEERWQTLGLAGNTALLLVAHTWRDQEGEEHIRIISARRATRIERKVYEDRA